MRQALHRLLVVGGTALVVGCSSHARPVVTPPPAPTPPPIVVEAPPPPPVLAPDPIAILIASSEALFSKGREELTLGHLIAARGLFDKAIEGLLQTPEGARHEPRLRTHYERLLDRISALEILALREGDGFTETRSEPAVIDELLAVSTFPRPAPAPETSAAVAADLATTAHDLPLDDNEKVLSYVELFQDRLRPFLQAGLDRSAQYLPMIQSVFRAEGLPLDLAYVPLIESGFKNTALSRASARGMWQFMLPTAQEQGLKQSWFVDERADPEKATKAAAQYLKSLHHMFDGDWNMALASYNAGPGRMQRAVKKSKINDYWRLTATSRYLPRETREYVPMIMAAIIIAKNPAQYGFEVAAADPLAYERVTVPDALDLRHVAEWANTDIESLRQLNPELRRTTTPVGTHALKVPLGTAAAVELKLAEAEPSLFSAFQRHVVKKGETMATIARKFKMRHADLASANDLRPTSRVKVGQTLMIPIAPGSALTSRPAATATPLAPAAAAAAAAVTYRVRSGDTLSSIARRFDTTVDALKRWNQLPSTRIDVGDRLTVRR